jgi:outer membrane protein assembly factor BamD
MPTLLQRPGLPITLALVALLSAACGDKRSLVTPGTVEPDKLLFERGMEALNKRKWITAREYFRQIVEGYPQSAYRSDSKLGLGDTYLGERTTEAFVLAANEFREFLTFFPTNPRADYAQFKLAMTFYHQMAKPERDQSNTKEALKEFDAFFERFADSTLAAEAKTRQREARDRLSESEYRVGLFYYRSKWWPGAIDRLQSVLKLDPGFTNRDAVYYYLAESLTKIGRQAEALPYFERIGQEFLASDYLAKAQPRIAELKAAISTTPPAPPKPPGP